jgi:hypothetical protein
MGSNNILKPQLHFLRHHFYDICDIRTGRILRAAVSSARLIQPQIRGESALEHG